MIPIPYLLKFHKIQLKNKQKRSSQQLKYHGKIQIDMAGWYIQQYTMWMRSKVSLILLIVLVSSTTYLEMQMFRVPLSQKKQQMQPITCKDQKGIDQDAQYRQVCYEKDIAYAITFKNQQGHLAMAADFTTPLSWLKGPDCKIEGSSNKCTHLVETFGEKMKDVKKNVASKFHKKKEAEKENSIIEGSSEIIRGELEDCQKMSFATKDSSRLSNFFEIIMLGLFIKGQVDVLQLEQTKMVSATTLSPNANILSDGAISMRMDSSSEQSFLNEIFKYIKSKDKVIGTYLGENNTITFGDLTSKYADSGFSSINWVATKEDQGYGKLVEVLNVGIEDEEDDSDEESEKSLPVILTLSSSYIGLPQEIIEQLMVKGLSKMASCKVDKSTLFVECSSSSSKSKIDKLLNKNLYFKFQGSSIMIPLKDLVRSNEHNKKISFNIKKTFNSRIVLGEPVFKKYSVYIDYSRDKIGFAIKRSHFPHNFNLIALVRFICIIFAFGLSLLFCYKPAKSCLSYISEKIGSKEIPFGQKLGLKSYKPIDQNPYEDLKGKIKDALEETEKQAEYSNQI